MCSIVITYTLYIDTHIHYIYTPPHTHTLYYLSSPNLPFIVFFVQMMLDPVKRSSPDDIMLSFDNRGHCMDSREVKYFSSLVWVCPSCQASAVYPMATVEEVGSFSMGDFPRSKLLQCLQLLLHVQLFQHLALRAGAHF